MSAIWSQIGSPLIVSVIALIVEYWIIQPIKSFGSSGLNRRERRLVQGAAIAFPVGILILIFLVLYTSLEKTLSSPASPSPQSSYPFWDTLTLVVLLYAFGILVLVRYRMRLGSFAHAKVQMDAKAKDWREKWERTATLEQREHARLMALLASRSWDTRFVTGQRTETVDPARLWDSDLKLAALWALLSSSALFIPLFVVWLQVFLGLLGGFGLALPVALGVLVFTYAYLSTFEQQHEGCYVHIYGFSELLERRIILRPILITGLVLTPLFMLAFRIDVNIDMGIGLAVASLATAFVAIPVLWSAILGASYRTAGLVVYLITPAK